MGFTNISNELAAKVGVWHTDFFSRFRPTRYIRRVRLGDSPFRRRHQYRGFDLNIPPVKNLGSSLRCPRRTSTRATGMGAAADA